MSGRALLELRGVAAGYGAIQALSAVDLEVAAGEIVTLIGANGAGKTTTLMAVCGVVPARAGEILLDGAPIHRLSPGEIVRRGVVQVPEGRQHIERRLAELDKVIGERCGGSDDAVLLGSMPGIAAFTATSLAGRATQAPPQQPRPVFRSGIDLVTVNVVVRDKNGQVDRGLTRNDFVVTEDGRPQTSSIFGFEELDVRPADMAAPSIPTVLGGIGRAAPAPAAPAVEAVPASAGGA